MCVALRVTVNFTHPTRLGMIALLTMVGAAHTRATAPDAVDQSIKRFLAQDDSQHPYLAIRHLEAENGNRKGWLEAVTEYSPTTGFRFQITDEGGSEYIRTKVLKAVLEGERDVIQQGESGRSSLALTNYSFQPSGIDRDGLVKVRLSPRREERVLVSGTMFLNPADGELVRLQGRLAKNPSFWIKDVDLVRTYERIDGVVVPIAMKTTARVRFLGEATFSMTYEYREINGHTVSAP